MDITIKMMDGTSHVLRVQPQDTVGSLKQLIQYKLGVPTETQKLVFVNGANTPLNDDTKRICEYGLHPGATVSLLVTQLVTLPVTQPVTQPTVIQVFLKNEKGKTSTYDVKPDETVANFKSQVEKREMVPSNQQRLIHEGREMSGGKLTDYGVRAHSTIYMTLRLRGG